MRLRAFLISALSVLGLFAAALPAQASTQICTDEAYCAGQAKFVSKGEHLKANDNRGDGHGVYVKYYRWDVDTWGEFTQRGGSNSGWKDHNMSMKEGAKIKYRVCLIDGSDVKYFTCSDYVVDYA
ncbi:hypothetical protein FHR84_002382 [Actinopolyspora biskrensis]|uniref:Secreted protein n=1 Tax=Actinopolyspora biskrensis TaxID=1470178 RepID=A0A852YY27_9ACTN|nr:hypothetical protein [Actinopolyspora biskrensis]NYH79048.1 hypothetical protein [Actinopolyspora biskrensis]